jgi:hypothetical protein
MDIRIKISRNNIHHWVDVPVYDGDGNQTGTKEVLQFDMSLPEHPNLPTYGMSVDYPISKQILLDAIRTKLEIVKAQISRDINVREVFDNWNISDYTVTDV